MTTPQARIPMMLLKHNGYYIIYENDQQVFINFKAEIGYDSFFKVPVAKWTWPNGKVVEVFVKPFTGVLVFSEPLPFNIEYKSGAWYADLRPRP